MPAQSTCTDYEGFLMKTRTHKDASHNNILVEPELMFTFTSKPPNSTRRADCRLAGDRRRTDKSRTE